MAARSALSRKEISHERIVESASRAIRRHGYAGAGVADIMNDAGLTHGGFYAHFASRDAMLAEAADRAGADTLASLAQLASKAPPGQGLEALVAGYLSQAHVKGVENGCPLAASGSEVSRQSPEVRRATTRRIEDLIELVARQLPDSGRPCAREQALATVATMVGALMLARAVDDADLSNDLRGAALTHLTSRTTAR